MTIQPRAPRFSFTEVPRRWFGGSSVGTHVINSVNLLFPAGERFFVRSVHHYLGQITDPKLCADVQGFFGQEGRHAQAHERYFEALEAQGYRFRTFLSIYEKLTYNLLETRISPALRLSITVALEHYTAILAENALRMHFLDFAHPSLRSLLKWHAAEEIEHRAVAFDVLQAVAPSYALRMRGMAVATLALVGFWVAGAVVLLAQEGADWSRGDPQLVLLRRGHSIGRNVFWRGIKEYLRRDFHPSKHALDDLAAAYLADAGLTPELSNPL